MPFFFIEYCFPSSKIFQVFSSLVHTCAYSVGGYVYEYLYVKVSDSAGCSPVDAADTATLRTDFSLRSQRIARI